MSHAPLFSLRSLWAHGGAAQAYVARDQHMSESLGRVVRTAIPACVSRDGASVRALAAAVNFEALLPRVGASGGEQERVEAEREVPPRPRRRSTSGDGADERRTMHSVSRSVSRAVRDEMQRHAPRALDFEERPIAKGAAQGEMAARLGRGVASARGATLEDVSSAASGAAPLDAVASRRRSSDRVQATVRSAQAERSPHPAGGAWGRASEVAAPERVAGVAHGALRAGAAWASIPMAKRHAPGDALAIASILQRAGGAATGPEHGSSPPADASERLEEQAWRTPATALLAGVIARIERRRDGGAGRAATPGGAQSRPAPLRDVEEPTDRLHRAGRFADIAPASLAQGATRGGLHALASLAAVDRLPDTGRAPFLDYARAPRPAFAGVADELQSALTRAARDEGLDLEEVT